MNSSTFIFGELAAGYTQYPDDSSSNLFKSLRNECAAPAQLIIHRNGNLMYYVFVRKLVNNKHIGLAIVTTGNYFTHIKQIFRLFRKLIEDLAEKGVIINYTPSGEITSTLKSLTKEPEVVAFMDDFQAKVNGITNFAPLPPVDFEKSITSKAVFNNRTDLPEKIAEASYRYATTIVLNESDYDTLRVTSYKSILKKMNDEKQNLINENAKLHDQIQQIKREKKRFKAVLFLSFILIACGFIGYQLYLNLTNTQDELTAANRTIDQQTAYADSLQLNIISLNNSLQQTKQSLAQTKQSLQQTEQAKAAVDNILHNITAVQPFFVSSCNVSDTSVTFDYYSPKDTTVNLTLKAVSEYSVETVTSSQEVRIHKGSGKCSINFAHSISRSKTYYVVLMLNGRIIGGKRW